MTMTTEAKIKAAKGDGQYIGGVMASTWVVKMDMYISDLPKKQSSKINPQVPHQQRKGWSVHFQRFDTALDAQPILYYSWIEQMG